MKNEQLPMHYRKGNKQWKALGKALFLVVFLVTSSCNYESRIEALEKRVSELEEKIGELEEELE